MWIFVCFLDFLKETYAAVMQTWIYTKRRDFPHPTQHPPFVPRQTPGIPPD